jgi:hypothetical protein
MPFSRDVIILEDVLRELRHSVATVHTLIEQLRELADDFDRLSAEEVMEQDFDQPDGRLPPSDVEELVSLESSAAREARRQRARDIESVVRRAAIEAFYEADAMLVSVSRKALDQ